MKITKVHLFLFSAFAASMAVVATTPQPVAEPAKPQTLAEVNAERERIATHACEYQVLDQNPNASFDWLAGRSYVQRAASEIVTLQFDAPNAFGVKQYYTARCEIKGKRITMTPMRRNPAGG